MLPHLRLRPLPWEGGAERRVVRLRARMNRKVEVLSEPNAFQLVTEGNCAAARSCGEQPEVNDPSAG